jgi:hypothetical protein
VILSRVIFSIFSTSFFVFMVLPEWRDILKV